MNKQLLSILLCISILVSTTGCGEYEQLEQTKVLERQADSLYSTYRDSLRKYYDTICDQNFHLYYQESLDSIKAKQINEIRDLIEN